MVAYVADLPIEGYTSDTRRLEPKVPWMERNDRLYWLWESEGLQWKESALTAEVKSMMGRMNHTEGLHTLQKIYGCELGEDGSSAWDYRDAYDGVTLLSLYGDTVVYKADIHLATVILDRWMSEELQIQHVKGYLEHRCLTDLQRYLKAGAEHLQRGFLEVPPRNRRCRMKHGDRTFLLGEVFGFYPREMEVRWFRGGVEIPTDFMEILPNPDGTFQVRTMVEVHEGDEETYKYQVDHSSLPEPVRVECEARSSSIRKIGDSIGGIAGGLVLLLLAVICVWMCRNKCAGLDAPDRREERVTEGGMREPSQLIVRDTSIVNKPLPVSDSCLNLLKTKIPSFKGPDESQL